MPSVAHGRRRGLAPLRKRYTPLQITARALRRRASLFATHEWGFTSAHCMLCGISRLDFYQSPRRCPKQHG